MMISRGVPNPRRRDDGWPLFGRAKRRVRGWKNDAIDLCTSRRPRGVVVNRMIGCRESLPALRAR